MRILTSRTRRFAIVIAALGFSFVVTSRANATELNCTSGCNFVSFDGALWSTSSTQGTGTGVINSFVRVGGNSTVVDGHNTGGTLSNDELNGHTFARQLSEVPILRINGALYYEFFLDINQSDNDPLLALNNVKICLSATSGNLTAADTCPTTALYSMGAFGGGGDDVLMNYSLNGGSGSGDLFMYIPIATLGTNTSNYVYLYSQFGAVSDYGNNAGFEEWATRICGETYGKKQDAFVLACEAPPPPPPPTPTPEPASLLLMGTGLAGLAAYVKRRRR